jgi:hypothetical protein
MPWDDEDRNKYENDLINQRLTWLGTFEGLLFVANNYATHTYLLPLVGFTVAVSVDMGIRAANKRINKLNGQAYIDWRGNLMPGTLIPKVIAGVWIILFLQNFHWWHALFSCSR